MLFRLQSCQAFHRSLSLKAHKITKDINYVASPITNPQGTLSAVVQFLAYFHKIILSMSTRTQIVEHLNQHFNSDLLDLSQTLGRLKVADIQSLVKYLAEDFHSKSHEMTNASVVAVVR